MKKIVVILCMVVLVMLFCACNDKNVPNTSQSSVNGMVPDNSQDNENEEFSYAVYRNGEVIVLETTRLDLNECEHGCYKIPFVPILKELGAEIIWQSKSIAKVSLNAKDYILDTEKQNMYEENDPDTLLLDVVYDGENPHDDHKGMCDGEFWVSDSVLDSFIAEPPINYNCVIDEDKDKIFCVPRVDNAYKLCINGINHENVSAKVETVGISDVYSISLKEVLEGCGFNFEWTDNTKAIASKNGKEYLINFSLRTFVEKEKEENLIANTDNREDYRCNYIFEGGKATILVDFKTLSELMAKIDAPIYMSKNYFTNSFPVYIWSDYGDLPN